MPVLRELVLQDLRIKTNNTNEILLMVLGGRKLSPSWLNAVHFNKCTWAVDSGVDCCFEAGMVPEKLIGDADSADPDAWQWARESGSMILKYDRDKNLTDFQIALDLLSKERSPEKKGVFLTGCFGGRFDHLWSTLVSFITRCDGYTPIGMADEKEGMIFLQGADSLELYFEKTPEAVSLIPFSPLCSGVSIEGVRWPLDKVRLEYGDPYSISNRIEGKNAVISLEHGLLGVYWEWRGVRD